MLPPPQGYRGSQHQQRGHEPAGDTIGDTGHRGFLRLCTVEQSDNRGQHGLFTDLLDFHHQRAFDVHRAPYQQVTRLTPARPAFARQQGLVHRALSIDDPAIGRHAFTRAYQHTITHRQICDRDPLLTCLTQARRRGRQQLDQFFRRLAGTVTGTHFQETTGQQEKREHGD